MVVEPDRRQGQLLPHAVSPFIGRTDERAAVHHLLDDERLVSLIGPGGAGKTRLAIEVASERKTSLSSRGPWIVELAPVSDPTRVADTIRAAVGAPEQAWQDPTETIVEWLGDDDILLVVDNCEHLSDGAAAVIHDLLTRSPCLTVLATSRGPLGIDGEAIWRVPPLGLPPAVTDIGIDEFDAVRLFVDRARRAGGDLAARGPTLRLVAEIVRRLDGMPLAIELAAAQTRLLTVNEILDGLDDRFRVLGRRDHDETGRHRTLEASVDWSHDLCTRPEQVALRRLAVFAGGFTVGSAEAVVADGDGPNGDVPRARVLDLLGSLADRCLVQVDRSGATSRFRLLETIRAYAWDRLREVGEEERLRDRHLAWAADLVDRAEGELVSSRQLAWLDDLEDEHDNLREALAWASLQASLDPALTMAARMSLFWKLRAHYGEARTVLTRLLDLGRVSPGPTRAAEWALADILSWMGDVRGSLSHAEAALTSARAAGDDWCTGRALWTIAQTTAYIDLPRSRTYATEAIEVGRRAGDVWLEGVALPLLGLIWRWSGRPDEAALFVAPALVIARDHDIPQIIAYCYVLSVPLLVWRGEFAEADRQYAIGSAAATSIRDPASAAQLDVEHVLGLQLRGRWAEAEAILERSTRELVASGAVSHEPHLRYAMLINRLATKPDEADEQLTLLLGGPGKRGARLYNAARARAAISLDAEPGERARLATAHALDVARRADNVWDIVELLALSALAQLPDETTRAEVELHEALGLAVDADCRPLIPSVLDALAAALACRGLDVPAARLLGAAAGARDRLGVVRVPVHTRTVTGCEDAARERLGGAFDHAWSAGYELSTADAVRYAQQNRGSRGRPASGWASLTPTEERVVELAAEGLTNPQIAERLFVSRGTVKSHLAHAFAKLSVTSRTELATVVLRRQV